MMSTGHRRNITTPNPYLWAVFAALFIVSCDTTEPGSNRHLPSTPLEQFSTLEGARERAVARLHLASAQAAAVSSIRGAGKLSAAIAETLDEAATLVSSGKCVEARRALGSLSPRPHNLPAFSELWARAFQQDPRFIPSVATLTPKELEAIRPLGGGSTLTLRFLEGGTTIAAFKPAQAADYSVYQAEIASWRLCEVLLCSFVIPYNRPVRIARHDFDALYADADTGKYSDYSKYFDELRWTEVDDDRFLYGTEKAWVKDFMSFPIEVRSVWLDLLTQKGPASALSQPIENAVAAWKKTEFSHVYVTPFLERVEGLSTRELARQLSDMLVFDYLVQNMDRFISVPQDFGENTQFGAGHLISIDNGAAFPPPEEVRVKPPVMFIERFSRGLVQRIEALDEEQTRDWLFPEATEDEMVRFDGFWQRRHLFLERVDALVEKYGEDAVLYLD